LLAATILQKVSMLANIHLYTSYYVLYTGGADFTSDEIGKFFCNSEIIIILQFLKITYLDHTMLHFLLE